MKTVVLAASRYSLIFTAVAALSVAYPASVQAVTATYKYTGNPFTFVTGVYTTSDFVTVMLTLASPLAPNMPLSTITPTAFTFSDGVQTITNLTSSGTNLQVATGAAGQITIWNLQVVVQFSGSIATFSQSDFGTGTGGFGLNFGEPGTWTTVADTGSTLSLMTLTFMALGLAARQFKRAAT